MTDDKPKCYVEIAGKSMLDWTLSALREGGGANVTETVFVGGYLIDRVRRDRPDLTFVENAGWANNNILASLFCAESHMEEGFVCSYSDTLYTGAVVAKAIAHPADIVLCVDTDWRRRYVGRTEHPESDGEKLIAEGDRVVHIHRDIAPERASGEYIGVAKFSAKGARVLRDHYHRVRATHAGKPWREAAVFEKAYKILLYQEMLEAGVTMHMVETRGAYIEVDTEQDFAYANRMWLSELAR
jgi:choline kinase